MSAYAPASAESDPQDPQGKRNELTPEYSDDSMAMLHAEVPSLDLDLKRPIFRSHKSFPYTLQTSSSSHQANTPDTSTGASPAPGGKTTSNPGDIEAMELPTVTFGGSAPTSPQDRLTPKSPKQDQSQSQAQAQQDLNGLDLGGDIVDDDLDDDDQPKHQMTAAELRAQKRKMKRFRFVHCSIHTPLLRAGFLPCIEQAYPQPNAILDE